MGKSPPIITLPDKHPDGEKLKNLPVSKTIEIVNTSNCQDDIHKLLYGFEVKLPEDPDELPNRHPDGIRILVPAEKRSVADIMSYLDRSRDVISMSSLERTIYSHDDNHYGIIVAEPALYDRYLISKRDTQ